MAWDSLAVWVLVVALLLASTGLLVLVFRALQRGTSGSGHGTRPNHRGVVSHHRGRVQPRRRAASGQAARVTVGPPRSMKVNMEALWGGEPIRKGAPLVVPRRHDPLWVETGWRRNGKEYQGYFRAAGRRWRGLIREPYPGGYQAYIWHPPMRALRGRPHEPCFRRDGRDGRYSVHFRRMPASVDHAIVNVEEVLADALRR